MSVTLAKSLVNKLAKKFPNHYISLEIRVTRGLASAPKDAPLVYYDLYISAMPDYPKGYLKMYMDQEELSRTVKGILEWRK